MAVPAYLARMDTLLDTPATVASVSLADFERDRDGFAQALGGSFERYGFAVVADHGIPTTPSFSSIWLKKTAG